MGILGRYRRKKEDKPRPRKLCTNCGKEHNDKEKWIKRKTIDKNFPNHYGSSRLFCSESCFDLFDKKIIKRY